MESRNASPPSHPSAKHDLQPDNRTASAAAATIHQKPSGTEEAFRSTSPARPLSTASISAMHRTLAVTELLELILLELRVLDLLLATRVSRRFHDVILTSKLLRTALFLEASPEHHSISHWPPKVNPLLSRMFPPSARSIALYGYLQIAYEDQWEDDDPAPWQRRGRNWLIAAVYENHEDTDLLCYMPLPAVDPGHYFTPAQRYKKASWRRMFATNPPMITRISNLGNVEDFGELPALQMGAIMPRIQQPLCRCVKVNEDFRNGLSREATMGIEVKSSEDLEQPLMVGFCGETWKWRAQRWSRRSGLIKITLMVMLDFIWQLCHSFLVHFSFLILPEWLVHFWWPQWSEIDYERKWFVTRPRTLAVGDP